MCRLCLHLQHSYICILLIAAITVNNKTCIYDLIEFKMEGSLVTLISTYTENNTILQEKLLGEGLLL